MISGSDNEISLLILWLFQGEVTYIRVREDHGDHHERGGDRGGDRNDRSDRNDDRGGRDRGRDSGRDRDNFHR